MDMVEKKEKFFFISKPFAGTHAVLTSTLIPLGMIKIQAFVELMVSGLV